MVQIWSNNFLIVSNSCNNLLIGFLFNYICAPVCFFFFLAVAVRAEQWPINSEPINLTRYLTVLYYNIIYLTV